MGFHDRILPHIVDILLEVPAAFRSEVSDALCESHDFETWRLMQDPVVEDTPAERLAYVSDMLADRMAGYIVQETIEARQEAVVLDTSTELDA